MIYVLAGLLALSIVALVYREGQHSRHVQGREKAWDLERGGLLNRIQHPQVYVPAVEATEEEKEKIALAEKELAEDEIDLIGTIADGSDG